MANSHPGLGLNLGAPAAVSPNDTHRPDPQLTVPSAIGVTPASPIESDGPSTEAGPSKISPRQGLQPLQTQSDLEPYDQRQHSIPPPPSPRRHRAAVSRVRGSTGGTISSSKSLADLSAMGVAIGSSSSRSPGVKEDRRAVSEHHRVFSHGDLSEEPWDEAPYDNR